ncbi:MAG: glutathione S-transferase family protein [Hyphomicrobiaceae bacterium]|nr:glutathione S-transferase family protein [Hyphomicrobiaceae bacterium]
MAEITLYHASPSRSAVILWLLEELGVPYDIKLLSLKDGEAQKPEFLALNPMGKVPVIVHKGVAISETGAIATYLADAFPEAGLGVPVSDPRRGVYLKWMFFNSACVEPAILERAFPRKEPAPRSAAGFGTADLVIDVLAQAASAARPYLLGAQFTAADVVLGSGLRFGTMFKLLPEREEFKAYLAALEARPPLKRANERDIALRK